VTIVNHAPLVALALTWSHLEEATAVLLAPFVLFVVAGAAAHRSHRAWMPAPRCSLALASVLLVLWLVCGFHLQPWGPFVLILEIVVFSVVVATRPATSSGSPAQPAAG
jgi:hypothetical protein